MTRKDYQVIATALARAIRNQPEGNPRAAAWATCNEVTDALNENSGSFNRSKFISWVETRAL